MNAIALMLASGVLAIVLANTSRRHRLHPAFTAQLSQDGRYWWDGLAWRDGLQEASTRPLRSADGYYWWDGGAWRPVANT